MPLTFNPFGSKRRVAPSSNADEQRESLLSPEERASNTQTGAAGSFFSRVETSPNQMPNGQSDFLKACKSNDMPTIEAFIRNGVDVNQISLPQKLTALHWASAHNMPDLTELLIRSGANVDQVTKDGESALHLACRSNNNPTIVSQLLAAGADVNAKQNDGMSPVFMACLHNNAKTAAILFEAGANSGCLEEAKFLRHYVVVGCLPSTNEETDAIITKITDKAEIARRDADLIARNQSRSSRGENIAGVQPSSRSYTASAVEISSTLTQRSPS